MDIIYLWSNQYELSLQTSEVLSLWSNTGDGLSLVPKRLPDRLFAFSNTSCPSLDERRREDSNQDSLAMYTSVLDCTKTEYDRNSISCRRNLSQIVTTLAS